MHDSYMHEWTHARVAPLYAAAGDHHSSAPPSPAVALLLLLRCPGACDPERAQRAEAVEVVRHGQQRPRHLPRRQDLVQPVQRLLPKVLSLCVMHASMMFVRMKLIDI
jgi:hypothetical protein